MLHPHLTLNCGGRLLYLGEPAVMAILNLTPDSFYDGGNLANTDSLLRKAEQHLREGASILDVGGVSTRPGAAEVSLQEELKRVIPAIEAIARKLPEAIISVDTYRAEVVRQAVAAGASVVNDVSAGSIDPDMFATVATAGTPYVLMHMQGTPLTMQQNPRYTDVILEVLDFFISKIGQLRSLGVKDIILDPGFGFGKTVRHNYELLSHLHVFKMLDYPVLAGISRKSMICKVLKIKPVAALNGTSALHMIALQQGARILRVHDVREAMEVVRLWQQVENPALQDETTEGTSPFSKHEN
jgi:dihydropteroate synthase